MSRGLGKTERLILDLVTKKRSGGVQLSDLAREVKNAHRLRNMDTAYATVSRAVRRLEEKGRVITERTREHKHRIVIVMIATKKRRERYEFFRFLP